MKYLVLLVIVMAVVWFIRNNRRDDAKRPDAAPPRRNGTPGAPQDMVQCPVCSVHLPRTDALPGPDGRLYCCADHRQRGG
ncbi:PP0621 family protein [Caenimonas aquaedulcis]|uniref:Uncharacterized protein n=1 Tax=Caenimonas aquaedulcis TaxID=2793270 RepID=A0A931H6F6_9BURK|nr:PP0621 family protein [Caenimonas aquaedulcis]MBG9389456.1 hypothetical protein [Caenimonas aquaedulcis]